MKLLYKAQHENHMWFISVKKGGALPEIHHEIIAQTEKSQHTKGAEAATSPFDSQKALKPRTPADKYTLYTDILSTFSPPFFYYFPPLIFSQQIIYLFHNNS